MSQKSLSLKRSGARWIFLLGFVVTLVSFFQFAPLMSDPASQAPTPNRIVIQEGIANIGVPLPVPPEEIVARTGINAWIDSGWTGENIKIGVLDQGFSGLVSFESTFGVEVTLQGNIAVYDTSRIEYGTNALQVIHALAPRADLFACQYSTFTEYSECVRWLQQDMQVQIINHSGGVPSLSLSGGNPWTQLASEAANAGILWINAAGDFAQGLFAANFVNNGSGAHNFRYEDQGDWLDVAPLTDGQNIYLTWQGVGAFQANQLDFQLIINYYDDELIVSDQYQRGGVTDTALDWVYVQPNRNFRIQILSLDGHGDGAPLLLFVPFTSLPLSDVNRSVIAPADSSSVLTIGALQGAGVPAYSGRGYSDTSGIKPDLVAPGEIYLLDNSRFYGTVAAAPIVAGAAALLMEANPNLSQQEILEFFRSVAVVDSGSNRGPDLEYGAGYLYMPTPINTPTLTSQYSPEFSTFTPTPTLILQATLPAESGIPVAVVAAESAYLREGPGVNFQAVGSAFREERLPVEGRSFDWYQVRQATGRAVWIAGSVVRIEPSGSLIRDISRPVAPPTQIPPHTPTFVPRDPPPTAIVPTIQGVMIVTRVVTATPTSTSASSTTPDGDNIATSGSATLTLTPTASTTLIGNCQLSAYTGYGALGQGQYSINVRSQPSTSSAVATTLSCAGVRTLILDQQALCANGETWLHGNVGWLRSDVIISVPSQNEANTVADRVCSLPTATFTATSLPPGITITPSVSIPEITPVPPAPSLSVGAKAGVGTAGSGGCYAEAYLSGPADLSGNVCIQNDTVTDCGRSFSSPTTIVLDFGGIGQNHHVWANTNYGSLDGGTHSCP